MGSVVKQNFESSCPNIIDYANSGMREEILDLYLCATCVFAISTGTGLDGVVSVFRRPVAFASISPIGYMPTFRQGDMLLAKHYVDTNTGEKLDFQTITIQGLDLVSDSNEFKKRGVHLVDNTPEEILDLSIEMLARVEGKWVETSEDLQLQDNFWRVFQENVIEKNQHILLHGDLRAKYSTSYLRNNQDWFN
jgi:putative glycosyltransferase (TIGR04372 family)